MDMDISSTFIMFLMLLYPSILPWICFFLQVNAVSLVPELVTWLVTPWILDERYNPNDHIATEKGGTVPQSNV
jgi:hypothetical protein